MWSYSALFSPLYPLKFNSVQFSPFLLIQSISVQFGLFCPLRLILSIFVQFSPFCLLWFYLVLFCPHRSHSVHSVHFDWLQSYLVILSTFVLFDPFCSLWSYSVHIPHRFYSVQFGLVRSILSTLVPPVLFGSFGLIQSTLFLFGSILFILFTFFHLVQFGLFRSF